MEYNIISLYKNPEMKEEMAGWFSSKWGIPYEIYIESMDECLSGKSVPQWYVAVEGSRIVGGIGVIENDFHDRPDLSPNLCALYVEPDARGRGIAGALLDFAASDMRKKGIAPLYLVTDHTSFYERYGWRFFCNVGSDDGISRLYIYENDV